MERYRTLPHTADGMFQAFGRTRAEAFGNAALALASLMWNWKEVEAGVSYPVEIRGKDLEQVLVKFLSEIIYLMETEAFLLGAVEELSLRKKPDGFVLNARFLGDNLSKKYEVYGAAKAVTYNEMRIAKARGGFMLQVVVDM